MKTLYMMMTGMLLAASANAADPVTTLYVCGNRVNKQTNWNPAEPTSITPGTDGNFTFTANGAFKMSTTKSESKEDWTAFDAGAKAVQSWTMAEDGISATADLTASSERTVSPAPAKDVTYTVNADFTTISASWEAGDVVFYIQGDQFSGGWDNWEDITKMTDEGDSVYTYVAENGINGAWKISTKGYGCNFGAGDEQPVVGTLYNLVLDSEKNLTLNTSKRTKITFTFVPDGTSTLLVAEEDEPVNIPEKLFFRGEITNAGWGSSYEMTKIGDTFSYSFDANRDNNENYITFTTAAYTTEGNGWTLPDGAVRYGSGNGNVLVSVNTPYDMTANNHNCWYMVNGKYTANVTFDATTGAGTVVFVEDTPSGVSAIEAAGEAAYYNLQGIRVMQPKHGIYVKVANGKATKVNL